ncbi:hypothetical protein I8752_29305 [Nostocaceae cyanobacterium CENA369]|uniref:Uncharacterized protein n=1 Tax=Dendronalium phyllosphericum CENA369 TaxID=1725256 RepID=A0A8J7IAA8_9NOST|nr:hypothetical protein [Dendronalium phyllosphericum]MBH8577008.1 hypothetical protein [Dendronalium phyllosphericum CENA369]
MQIPDDWYAQQAIQAARELDFDLQAACETEIQEAVSATFEPMPTPEPGEIENSIYNFNTILDMVND